MARIGHAATLDAQMLEGSVQEPAGWYTYQWTKDGKDLPGATSHALVLDPVKTTDAGIYRVRIQSAGAQGGTPAASARGQAEQRAGATGQDTSPFFILQPVDQEWTVTSDADDGPGTLRQTLKDALQAPGVNGIRFALPPAAVWEIRLQSTLPTITTPVAILGPGATPLTLSGRGACRPFFVDGGTLSLAGFTLSGGLGKGGDAPGGGGAAAGMGGAIFLNKGGLELRAMAFTGNVAQGGTSSPGTDGENGGGAGFESDSPAQGGGGAGGGHLGGRGGRGYLDGTATTDSGGGPALGDGGGGGAARGGLLSSPVSTWADNLPGGPATFAGGGGFSVGPLGGGGDSTSFGGGGGGSGGVLPGVTFPGSAGGAGGTFGGDGVPGDGVTGGRGGGGGGMGGAIFLRSGSLLLVDCTFTGNKALPGQGGQAGLAKAGAIFIHAYDPSSPFDLAMLQNQTYQDNHAADVAEDPSYDNEDYYVAQTHLANIRGSALDRFYRRYRENLRLGIPWIRTRP